MAFPLEVTAVVPALAIGYALLARRCRPSRPRALLFALALALVLASFATPLERLALHRLLTAHLLQNVVLAEWAPALLVLAVPPALARRVPRPNPFATLVVWLGTYFLWHLPVAYDAALRRPDSVLLAEHVCYLVAGLALWWPVVHGGLSNGARALYLFAAFVLASPLGLMLALLPRAAYSFYADAPRLWGVSALTDQQIAGVTMAAEQAVVFFVVCAIQFSRFLQEESGREAFRSFSR